LETTLKSAYKEVGQILNLLGNDYKAKVPSSLLALFEQNTEEKNISDLYEEIKHRKVSRDALIILSILNAKYWANEEEKRELKAVYDKNEEEYQRKINSYQRKDWLKKERNEEKIVEEVSLVKVQENSIWTKIKNFLKNLIPKRK
jgi:IS4 transposase